MEMEFTFFWRWGIVEFTRPQGPVGTKEPDMTKYHTPLEIAEALVAPAMAAEGMEEDMELAWYVADNISWRAQTGVRYVKREFLNREALVARIIEING